MGVSDGHLWPVSSAHDIIFIVFMASLGGKEVFSSPFCKLIPKCKQAPRRAVVRIQGEEIWEVNRSKVPQHVHGCWCSTLPGITHEDHPGTETQVSSQNWGPCLGIFTWQSEHSQCHEMSLRLQTDASPRQAAQTLCRVQRKTRSIPSRCWLKLTQKGQVQQCAHCGGLAAAAP